MFVALLWHNVTERSPNRHLVCHNLAYHHLQKNIHRLKKYNADLAKMQISVQISEDIRNLEEKVSSLSVTRWFCQSARHTSNAPPVTLSPHSPPLQLTPDTSSSGDVRGGRMTGHQRSRVSVNKRVHWHIPPRRSRTSGETKGTDVSFDSLSQRGNHRRKQTCLQRFNFGTILVLFPVDLSFSSLLLSQTFFFSFSRSKLTKEPFYIFEGIEGIQRLTLRLPTSKVISKLALAAESYNRIQFRFAAVVDRFLPIPRLC